MKWIPTKDAWILPAGVQETLQKLHRAGHSAYLVGGCVRDFLLGLIPQDYDVATGATPDEVLKIFPQALTVGKFFGVLKVPTFLQPAWVEVATFRKDAEYRDYRRPVSVQFAGPMEDAQRRDFTINALFYDADTGQILDGVGGVCDLQESRIRAIGIPQVRFQEDALRLLRAVRFKTQFGFELEPETARAIQECAPNILKISIERIQYECTRMWKGPRPSEALQLLSGLGLLVQLLPEVASALEQSPSDRLFKILNALPNIKPLRSFGLAWAAVLYEVGRSPDGLKKAREITRRFKMSQQDAAAILSCLSDSIQLKEAFQMREATLQRWMRQPHFEEALLLHRMAAMAWDGNLAFYEFCSKKWELFQKEVHQKWQPLLNGEDLVQLGFQPGPIFKEILTEVDDLTLENQLKTKEDAIHYVIQHFASSVG